MMKHETQNGCQERDGGVVSPVQLADSREARARDREYELHAYHDVSLHRGMMNELKDGTRHRDLHTILPGLEAPKTAQRSATQQGDCDNLSRRTRANKRRDL